VVGQIVMLDSRPKVSEPVRFGVFELDPGSGELRKNGLRLNLQDQPLQVLEILLEKPGQVVTREELQQRLWPSNTFVEFDKGIYNAIKRLRETLSDDAGSPRYIETIPRRGYRFIAPVNGNGAVSVAAPSAQEIRPVPVVAAEPRPWYRRKALLAAIAAAALLFGVPLGLSPSRIRLWLSRGGGSPPIHSLAVLPLQNLSNDPAQEYFSDGMTDALITDLAQIGSVKVISRTTSMQYKQTKKSLPEIARELGVDGIIEGAVQHSGGRVRISAQLIHGPTDKHLWANSYERELGDVFGLEREVTEDIARQVQARLTTENQAAVAQFRPINPKALDAYLQGSYHLNGYAKGAGDEEKRKAAEYFQQAIDADPTFASAYNGLANAHLGLLWPSRQDAQAASHAAERSVALDPNSSDAHRTLGGMREAAWDWTGAEEQYRRAIALNHNSASAHGDLGNLLDILGRLDEGWKEQQIALELDPNNVELFDSDVSDGLELRGEDDRAIAIYQMFLKRDPGDGYTHIGIARDYMKMGMHKEGIVHLEQFWTLFGFPDVSAKVHRALATSGYRGAILESAKALEHLMATHQVSGPVTTAEFYATVGDKERAFYWLEQAYAQHDVLIAGTDDPLGFVETDPLLGPLRSDPRYKDLLRRMGLQELQVNESRANGQQNGHN